MIRSDDYRLSRLLHARTDVRLPMDHVVRRLQTVRGKKLSIRKIVYEIVSISSGNDRT